MKVNSMHCKKCGKAIGSGALVCPYCGSTLSPEQLKLAKEERKKMFGNPELLTEKYGEKIVYRNEDNKNGFLISLLVFAVIVLIVFLILLFTSII